MLEKGDRLSKPESCSDEIYEIMLKCWNLEASLRPTFDALFQHFSSVIVSQEQQNLVASGEKPCYNYTNELFYEKPLLADTRCDSYWKMLETEHGEVSNHGMTLTQSKSTACTIGSVAFSKGEIHSFKVKLESNGRYVSIGVTSKKDIHFDDWGKNRTYRWILYLGNGMLHNPKSEG